jgi:hypothetical protein
MQKTASISRKWFPVFVILGFILVAAGCNKKASSVTPSLPGNEFLTTVQLQLVNVNDPTDHPLPSWTQMSPYTHTYQVDSAYFNNAFINLKANSTYTCYLVILDSTKSPVDSVTPEIQQRENYHLIYYQPTPIDASNIVISNTSTDIPTTDWVTGDATDTTAGGVSVNELEIPPSSVSPLNLVVTRTDLDDNNPPMQIGIHTQWVTGAASSGIIRVVQRHQPNAKNGTYAPGSTDFDITLAVNIQ